MTLAVGVLVLLFYSDSPTSSSVALVAIHSDSHSQGKPLGVAVASLLQSSCPAKL